MDMLQYVLTLMKERSDKLYSVEGKVKEHLRTYMKYVTNI